MRLRRVFRFSMTLFCKVVGFFMMRVYGTAKPRRRRFIFLLTFFPAGSAGISFLHLALGNGSSACWPRLYRIWTGFRCWEGGGPTMSGIMYCCTIFHPQWGWRSCWLFSPVREERRFGFISACCIYIFCLTCSVPEMTGEWITCGRSLRNHTRSTLAGNSCPGRIIWRHSSALHSASS